MGDAPSPPREERAGERRPFLSGFMGRVGERRRAHLVTTIRVWAMHPLLLGRRGPGRGGLIVELAR
jgi:hypothetical protein